MLNEDRIKLMTSIASFEQREGKRIAPASRYFQSDYISSRMLRSFFSFTFCYALCMFIWVLYNMERLLGAINLGGLAGTLRTAGILYMAGLVIYLSITYVVYRKRYECARRGMKIYVAKLKRLEKRYEYQSRTKEVVKEGPL